MSLNLSGHIAERVGLPRRCGDAPHALWRRAFYYAGEAKMFSENGWRISSYRNT